jgi:predicted RND superfamily exporter protein
MKIFSFIKANKYPIAICAIFALVALCLFFFFQGLKKDHSLDTYKLQQRLLEDNRQEIVKTRAAYETIIAEQEKQITVLYLRDSVLAVHAADIQSKIKYIESPKYVKEKLQPVNNYTDADLQQYFDNLKPMPEPVDY